MKGGEAEACNPYRREAFAPKGAISPLSGGKIFNELDFARPIHHPVPVRVAMLRPP